MAIEHQRSVRYRALVAAAAVLVIHNIDPLVADQVAALIRGSGLPLPLITMALHAGMTVEEIGEAILSGDWPDTQTLATMAALRS